MFICKLCDKGLSSGDDILGTYCGHIYHQACLDNYLMNRSHLCPTCEKSLRVDINCISSGYAVLSLYPEEDTNAASSTKELPFADVIDQDRNNIEKQRRSNEMKENIVLKQKLVEVIQSLIFMQNELKARNRHHSLQSPLTDDDVDLLAMQKHSTKIRKKESKLEFDHHGHRAFQPYDEMNSTSISDMIVQNILQPGSTDIVSANNVEMYMASPTQLSPNAEMDSSCFPALDTPELVILPDKAMLKKSLSEEEKNRILRSKRREYLTWRNKAQTWINKMKAGSERLFQTEEAFTPEEYLQQLRLFFNKLYTQSMIVEEAKQAAVVYTIIENVSDDEMNEVNEKIHYFTQTCTSIINGVLHRLNSLEAKNANLEAELRLADHEKRGGGRGGRGSSVACWSEEDDDEDNDNDKETVIERKVIGRSTATEQSQQSLTTVMILSGLEVESGDVIDSTSPVFV